MHIHFKNANRYHNFSNAMTDISFLLIIFFLVAAVFIADQGLFLLLPDKETVPLELKRDEVVLIEIQGSEAILIDGVKTTLGSIKNMVSEKLRLKSYTAFIIDASPETSYQKVFNVLEEAKKGGADTFSITSREAEPVPVEIEEEE